MCAVAKTQPPSTDEVYQAQILPKGSTVLSRIDAFSEGKSHEAKDSRYESFVANFDRGLRRNLSLVL